MKRVLFFAITLLIVSCNNKKEEHEENKNEQDSKTENLDEAEEIDVNKPDLQSLIVVNKTNLSTTTLNGLNNNNAIALDVPGMNIYYVDLLSVSNTEAGIAAWLKNHDTHINFGLSSPFIEVAHNLRAAGDLAIVRNIPENQYKKYTWPQLANQVNLSAGNHYQEYLNLGPANGSINPYKSGFDQNNVIYSTALFNSIIANHGLSNPEIAFAKATLRNYPTIFIRVKEGSFTGYYDFTHRPPDKQITKDVTYKFL